MSLFFIFTPLTIIAAITERPRRIRYPRRESCLNRRA